MIYRCSDGCHKCLNNDRGQTNPFLVNQPEPLKFTHDSPTQVIRASLRSLCAIERIWACVSLLRRGLVLDPRNGVMYRKTPGRAHIEMPDAAETDAAKDLFCNTFYDNFPIWARSCHNRILLSFMVTLNDISRITEVRDACAMALVLLREKQLARMTTLPREALTSKPFFHLLEPVDPLIADGAIRAMTLFYGSMRRSPCSLWLYNRLWESTFLADGTDPYVIYEELIPDLVEKVNSDDPWRANYFSRFPLSKVRQELAKNRLITSHVEHVVLTTELRSLIGPEGALILTHCDGLDCQLFAGDDYPPFDRPFRTVACLVCLDQLDRSLAHRLYETCLLAAHKYVIVALSDFDQRDCNRCVEYLNNIHDYRLRPARARLVQTDQRLAIVIEKDPLYNLECHHG